MADDDAMGYVRVSHCVVDRVDRRTDMSSSGPDRRQCPYALVCRDLARFAEAGVLTTSIPRGDSIFVFQSQHELQWASFLEDRSTISSGALARGQTEGAIATSLLGELESFPDADADVILDVRARIAGARAGFRAAMAHAASAVDQRDATIEDVGPIVADLRRRFIDEALERIRDELAALQVRRTLLRVSKDKYSIASAGASIAMAIGAGATPALQSILSGVVAAPLIAAAAGELEHRQQLRAAVHARPYWFLHEAGDGLRSRTRRR